MHRDRDWLLRRQHGRKDTRRRGKRLLTLALLQQLVLLVLVLRHLLVLRQ